MGKLMEGTADGSSPNDPGTQGSGGVMVPSEAHVVKASEAHLPGKPKPTGFQDVAGTK